MKLIVGLGNPGEQYIGSRHNLGFYVLDEFARKINAGDWQMEDKFKSEIIKYEGLILLRPQTFMNNSGLAVSRVATFFKIDPEEILIIHDELDLPVGHLKIRLGGAAAGHHGVESVIEKLGTDKFARLRLGIGNQKAISGEHKQISFNAEHFVLEPFTQSEQSQVKKLAKRGIKALELILEKGLEPAQNQFN